MAIRYSVTNAGLHSLCLAKRRSVASTVAKERPFASCIYLEEAFITRISYPPFKTQPPLSAPPFSKTLYPVAQIAERDLSCVSPASCTHFLALLLQKDDHPLLSRFPHFSLNLCVSGSWGRVS